jgi:hypothetical protein
MMNYLRMGMAGFGIGSAAKVIVYSQESIEVGVAVLLIPIFVTYGYKAYSCLTQKNP